MWESPAIGLDVNYVLVLQGAVGLSSSSREGE